MTRLFIDTREVDFPHTEMSLDQIIKHVESTEMAPDSVIRQIHLDGTPLISETVQESIPGSASDITDRERIEIFTSSISDIAKDSIAEAISYLARVESVIPSLSISFQSNPDPEAFQNLKQLYEGFYWLNLLLDRLQQALHCNTDELQVQGATIKEHHEKLAGILRQMIESHQRSEFILISDLLEYEVLPFIPAWKEIFSTLATRIAS
jgi:flagellin-specific chaperone FliS